MPNRKRVTIKTLSREEQRFIGQWVKLGGHLDNLPNCERLAKLKRGEGAKMLKRAHVAAEIARQMEPVRIEHMRQELVSDAVNQVIAKLEEKTRKAEEEAKAATAEVEGLIKAPKMSVNTVDLEHELMRLAIHLDIERHPQVKLSAIQAGFVVSGILENGNVRRVVPKEPGDASFNNVIYGDLFDNMHAEREQTKTAAPVINAEPQVFDLMPHQALPADVEMPAPGEAIESIAGEPDPEPDSPSIETIKARIRKLTQRDVTKDTNVTKGTKGVLTVDAG